MDGWRDLFNDSRYKAIQFSSEFGDAVGAIVDHIADTKLSYTAPSMIQVYVNRGPVYMLFRDGEKAYLASHDFGMLVDMDGREIKRPGPSLLFFFARLINCDRLPDVARNGLISILTGRFAESTPLVGMAKIRAELGKYYGVIATNPLVAGSCS